MPPDAKTPIMLLGLPLGTYLPAGVSLQFGKEAAKPLPIQSCDRSGCLAEYAVTDAEIDAMLKGADVTISIQNQQQQPVTVTVPVAGFAEAYAKIQ
jgi:invasion protein IalB